MTLPIDLMSAVATFTGFLLFLGPSPAIRTIHRTRSTGVTPLVPLVSMFTCGWIWAIYGLLDNDIFPLMITNVMGVVLTTVYISVFYRFSSDKRYAHKVVGGFGSVITIVSVYALLGSYGYTGQSYDAVKNVMGYIGNVVVFVFFAAPFENVAQVFRHRSGVFLPITIVLATLLNASAWFTYGLLKNDWLIVVPNIGALVIGSIQVAVYLYFHPSKHPLPAGTTVEVLTSTSLQLPMAETDDAALMKAYVAVQSPHHGSQA